jgi:hypothetical protein
VTAFDRAAPRKNKRETFYAMPVACITGQGMRRAADVSNVGGDEDHRNVRLQPSSSIRTRTRVALACIPVNHVYTRSPD